ncbi:hypothetical protein HYU13_06075, partial [Candidatus Woesearchaeota archaeon]|nr:hypothetical protein [Candidatus Woesearchaeota archaeon]
MTTKYFFSKGRAHSPRLVFFLPLVALMLIATSSEAAAAPNTWLVGTPSKSLEMSEQRKDGINAENIRNITTSIDESELNALGDGKANNAHGEARYNQYLSFENTLSRNSVGSEFVRFQENDDGAASDFFYVKSQDQIARYSLEFKTSFTSDIEDDSGISSVNGTVLGDFEDEQITIIGMEYVITKARRNNSSEADVELTLIGGQVRDALEEGDVKNYTLNGKNYEVTVTSITDTGTFYAKFSVNGEATASLAEGETYALSDGVRMGVTDIIPGEEGDVAGDLTVFVLGADKVVLRDDNIKNSQASHNLNFNGKEIGQAAAIITGSVKGARLHVDTIQLNITADDNYYVAPGHNLSEYMDEPEALLGSWDIFYSGLENITTETIRIKASGSDKYEIVFADGSNNPTTFPFASTSGGSNLKIGDSNDDLVLNGSHVINKNDYFVVTDLSASDGNRKTYALRYGGATNAATGENASVKFDNLGTGERIEVGFNKNSGDSADALLSIGGIKVNVINASDDTINDFDIMVDLDGDGVIESDTDVVALNTEAGLKIEILNASDSILISFSTPDSDDYDNVIPTPLQLNITAANGKMQFSEAAQNQLSFISPSSEGNIKYAYTSFGAKAKWEDFASEPDALTIDYPKSQRKPKLHIIANNRSSSSPSRTITNNAPEASNVIVLPSMPISTDNLNLSYTFT